MERPAPTVLAIDDQPDNLLTLKALLEDVLPGITVLTASNGSTGLALAAERDPDAVLLDVVMPGMDGFEVCRRLKSDPRTAEIPVVFLTALRTDRENRVKALEVGAEGLLSKPLDELELVAQVRAMARVKQGAVLMRDEARRLKALVAERTWEIEQGRQAALNVLEDLREENEARKRSETALRESEERYRNLVLHSPDAILINNQDRVTLVNLACVRLFGATAPEDLLGRSPYELFHPDFHAQVRERIAEMRSTGAAMPPAFERIVRLDGQPVDVEVVGAPFAWGGAQAIHVILRDVTEARRAQLERERFLTALEQAGDAIVITDRQGVVQYVNPAFELTSGYTRSEAIGQRPGLWRSGAHDRAFYSDLWSTINGGKTWRGRFVNLRKDGTRFTEEATITPVRDGTGAIVHFVAVKRDVSERLRIEAQLRQSQKMESIGRLAGGVAHDFNNLLSVILGYTTIATERLRDGDPLRTELLEVSAAAERATGLTRQLLAFSRLQAQELQVLDLNRVLVDLEKMLGRLIGEDLALELHLEPNLPTLRADRGQLEQVVLNLAVNARDAMPDGGRLELRTSRVQVAPGAEAAVPAGDFLVLAVRDTGTGMAQAVLDHLFEPFFTTKEAGRGTGLGLSTVYGIVKQSGGAITVESALGQGSTFRVFLPVAGAEAGPHVRTPASTAVRGTETVLVVEDDEAVRSLVARMLESFGYRVIAANGGGDALLAVEEHQGPLHLVLADVVMPQMNGREVVERLQRLRPGLPALFMSGYTNDAVALRGVLSAGVHLIHKPFNAEELARRIRAILDAPGGRP